MKGEIFILLVLIAVLSVTTYVFFSEYFFKTQSFNIVDNSSPNIVANSSYPDLYPQGMLFYDNIRFSDKFINYSINPDCSSTRVQDAREAFDILASNTPLVFSEVGNNGQIDVSCSQEVKEVNSDHFIAGEGGPSYIINTSKYQVILNGSVLLYKDSSCTKPIVAIHEVLHVLGFKHSSDPQSIMYNVSSCGQKITPEIISKIYSLYQDPSLPDLAFEDVVANKSGVFLDFNVIVSNEGLVSSQDVNLSVYADDEFVSRYDIGPLDVGAGKILSVQNARIAYNTNKISFFIDEENSIKEIDKKNNIKNLVIS